MPTPSPQRKKLLDQMRDALRAKHYSYSTEETALTPIRPARPKRVSNVLSKDEARNGIVKMNGVYLHPLSSNLQSPSSKKLGQGGAPSTELLHF